MAKILVVDDSVEIREVAVLSLKGAFPCKITEASNGKIALEMLQKETFDLLVLDKQMPEVDGIQVLQLLRNAGNKIPTIVMTVVDNERTRDKINDLDALYLEKPFDADMLVGRAMNALKRSGFTLK